MTATIINLPPKIDIVIDSIPKELKEKDKWVLWRWEQRGPKWTKPPFQINGERADITNSKHWASFQDVLKSLQSGQYTGIGFALSDDDSIIGYDLDHCLDKTGELQQWADKLIKELNSYTEVSPSGDGLRVFITGDVPVGGRQTRGLPSPNSGKTGAVECYKNDRYFTVTGIHFPNTPITLEERPDTIWHNFFDKQEKKVKSLFANPKAKKLYEGDWKEDYGSQSDADLALCRYLADIVDGEKEKLDELFRKSKLFRPKWDEVHFGDGTTYGAATIQKAIDSYKSAYHLTETGDAIRFAKLYADKLRYCGGEWYIWDGKRLKQDSNNQINNLMDGLRKVIDDEARECGFEDRKKALLKHSKDLESKSKTEAVIYLAHSRDPLSITSVDDLDYNNHVFNTQSGIMEKGDLRPHDFLELQTKISSVSYDPRADSPTWYEFLQQIQPDQEIIDYLARCVGYSMTGLTVHQVIFFLYGLGANGKSTFINTIGSVFGDYSRVFPSEIFMVGKDQHPTGLSDLRGIRLAVASELEEGKRFNEQLLKWITGEDKISVRRMHGNFFEFTPHFKLWIVGNHKPSLRGTDFAIRRRFHLIPFERTIAKANQDLYLKDKLKLELDGIFNWCVKGLLDWMAQGLNPPKKVLAATEDYFEEQDIVSHLIIEEFILGDEFKVSVKLVYDRYVLFAKQRGEYVQNSRTLSQKLIEKGFKKEEEESVFLWVGFKLRDYKDSLESM